jgi:hypothetical protein
MSWRHSGRHASFTEPVRCYLRDVPPETRCVNRVNDRLVMLVIQPSTL